MAHDVEVFAEEWQNFIRLDSGLQTLQHIISFRFGDTMPQVRFSLSIVDELREQMIAISEL